MSRHNSPTRRTGRGLDLDNLHGRRALVTGASSGIGRAFARELAARGADVVLVSRSKQRLKELTEDLRRDHVPQMAVYGASKAFVLNFSRALWAENRGTGVQVLALCPGSTETEFFQIAGEDAAVGGMRTTDQVVASALRGLARGKPSVVDGRRNATLAFLSARLPERMSITAAERSVRPSASSSD